MKKFTIKRDERGLPVTLCPYKQNYIVIKTGSNHKKVTTDWARVGCHYCVTQCPYNKNLDDEEWNALYGSMYVECKCTKNI